MVGEGSYHTGTNATLTKPGMLSAIKASQWMKCRNGRVRRHLRLWRGRVWAGGGASGGNGSGEMDGSWHNDGKWRVYVRLE